jgi:hypothetical protein
MQPCQHTENTKRLLQTILAAVDSDNDYFISGSLSFLPLLDYYRWPGHDIDFSISQYTFRKNKNILKGDGYISRVPLKVIPIMKQNPFFSHLPIPTKFYHILSSHGLLDLTLFRKDNQGNYLMPLVNGISLWMPKEIEEKFRQLSFLGINFRAAPLELAILPKLISYLKGDPLREKDLLDIEMSKDIVNYEFIKFLLQSITLVIAGIKSLPFVREMQTKEVSNSIRLIEQYQRSINK